MTISGKGKLAAAAQHNLRERETFNARETDQHRNIHLAGARTSKELAKLWDERAPEKVRKNAVHALEYVITASPEKMQQMGKTDSENYLRDAHAWLAEKHGAENILSAVIHNDETTPHLQVLVIPIDERGKLNARALVGGKAQLSAMQTDFAKRVGAKYEMDRGIERSKAQHHDIKSYYSRVNSNELPKLSLPERHTGGFMGLGRETYPEWEERASNAVSEALRGISAKLVEEKNALLDELHETKLKLANLETKAERTEFALKAAEAANALSRFQGADRDKRLEAFHKAYIANATEIPKNIRQLIDEKLISMDKKGFGQLELEREIAERMEANRIALRERERQQAEEERQRLRAFSKQKARERDDGYER